MDHLITCECGQSIRISRSQAGQEIQCTCGKALRIPTLRGLSELPLASDAAPESARESAQESSTWGGWRGSTLAISFGLCAIFVLPCGFFLFQRLSIDPSLYTAEAALEGSNAFLDTQGMEQLTTMWYGAESSGLGIKQKPDFYYYYRFAKDRELWAGITGAVAGICGLIAAAVWITAPKKKKKT